MNGCNLFLLAIYFFAKSSYGQTLTPKILQVGAGEYLTTYRTDEGKLFLTNWNNGRIKIAKLPVKNIIDVEGAQYTNIALDSIGAVYIIGIHPNGVPYAKPVPFDEDGNPFIGNSKVYGWFQAYLTLNQGKIFIWGEDILKLNAGQNFAVPKALDLPEGKKMKKLVVLTLGEPCLMALATDGSVWRYSKGKFKPERIKLPAPAREIAGVGAAAYVVETANDLLAWGYLGSYLGLNDLGTTPMSIKKKWTAIGCVFPSKELVGNYNTLHIIDANNNMFGAGENVQGEVGNGKEYPYWKTNLPVPYAWNWTHGQMITKPVQIPGKFKNLCTSNTITFYFYVQDLGDNWYSWGRNKSRSLGNGISMNSNDESNYPNALNIPAPTLVSPLTVKWKIHEKIKVEEFKPKPLANAGVNQYLKGGSTNLFGSGSSQQGDKIIKYEWTKISGEEAIINNPNTFNTTVTNLQKGIYIFRLTITNTNRVTAFADVTITVEN